MTPAPTITDAYLDFEVQRLLLGSERFRLVEVRDGEDGPYVVIAGSPEVGEHVRERCRQLGFPFREAGPE